MDSSYLLLLISFVANAQIEPEANLPNIEIQQSKKNRDLRQVIIYHVLSEMNKSLIDNIRKDEVHLFAVAVSFDKDGKIDTVSFSKKIEPSTERLINATMGYESR